MFRLASHQQARNTTSPVHYSVAYLVSQQSIPSIDINIDQLLSAVPPSGLGEGLLTFLSKVAKIGLHCKSISLVFVYIFKG